MPFLTISLSLPLSLTHSHILPSSDSIEQRWIPAGGWTHCSHPKGLQQARSWQKSKPRCCATPASERSQPYLCYIEALGVIGIAIRSSALPSPAHCRPPLLPSLRPHRPLFPVRWSSIRCLKSMSEADLNERWGLLWPIGTMDFIDEVRSRPARTFLINDQRMEFGIGIAFGRWQSYQRGNSNDIEWNRRGSNGIERHRMASDINRIKWHQMKWNQTAIECLFFLI